MRLASFDFVTAVAVVGAIDAVQGHDTVIPALDLSQTVPRTATVDLTDFDLADLMSIEIGPATPRDDFADIDLGEFSLEQLLDFEARPADEPQPDITVAAIEDLIQIEVRAADPDGLPSPFDLTELELEILEDLQFGVDAPRTEISHRQFAALDLSSHLDDDDINEIVLIGGSADPISADSSDYEAIEYDAISTATSTDTVYLTASTDAPVNDAPVASPDRFVGTEDTAIAGNVLRNDTDPDGDPLAVTAGTFATLAGGTVVIAADGSFTYTPAADFNGADSVDYTVSDGKGGIATGTVTFDVAPVNDAPVASPDRFVGTEDTAITGNVLLNDTDPDGDPLAVTAGTFATLAGGTVVIAADGSFTYTPAADFNGVDSFDYTIDDGNGGTATDTVTIDVAPVNDAPVAKADSFTGTEDTAVIGNVLANDSDPDGDALSVAAGTFVTANGGSVVMAADGGFTYTPPADFSGADSFDYTIDDGNGGTATATATIDVAPVNDAPVAKADSFTGTEDVAVTGNVLANDTDPDGDALSVAAGTFVTANGGSVVMAADGGFTYTPPADFSGADSFDYTIDDGNGGTATATATIDVAPVNDAPVAKADSFTGTEDVAVTGNVLANDTDPDGDALSVAAGTFVTANGGSVVMAADGGFTYTPPADFSGADSFDYTIDDGNGGTATATATIDVAPVNDAPVAKADSFTGTEDVAVTGNVLANDTDPDGDALSVTAGTFITANGGSVVMAADGRFTYTPPADFHGADSFDYTVDDGNGGTATATATIDVAPVNDAPVAADDGSATLQDAAIIIDVLANDTDPDGDTLSVTSVGAAANGTVVINVDGTLTYTPNPGYTGIDSFSYTVDDGNGGTASATATVSVAAGGVILIGTSGDDILTGTAFEDTLEGRAGDDILYGLDGNDALIGGQDNDYLVGGGGADSLDGGAGIDIVDYSGSGGAVTVDLLLGTGIGGDAQGDTLTSVEHVIGSDFDDTLTGDSGPNTLDGGAGDDVLIGAGGGLDTLIGGAGNDTLIGEDGIDILIGGAGADTLDGGTNTDTADYSGSGAGVKVDLAAGIGAGGDAAGDTLANIENLTGSAFDDAFAGDAGNNILDGGAGNDTIDGGAGIDTLYGSDGNDTLIGGLGADSQFGGAGDDSLEWDSTDTVIDGGTGTDTLRVTSGDLDLSTTSGTLSGIEIIDLQADAAANSIWLTAADVLAVSDTNTLTIIGNGGDSIGAGAGWSDAGFDADGNHVYTQMVGGDLVTLVVGPAVIIGFPLVNEAPVANADSSATLQNTAVSIDVLANDTDPEGDTLTVTSVGAATNGTVVINVDGTLTYTPNPGYIGTDSFTYTVDDGNGGTAVATVTVNVSTSGVILIGTNANEILIGGNLSDYLDGMGGNDILIGLAGDDTLYGGDGDDGLEGSAGADILSGGLGNDTASYVASTAGVSVDLTLGTGTGGDAEGDTLSGIENLAGSAYDDVLYGDGQANLLLSGPGNDILDGGGGADTLEGGDGDDILVWDSIDTLIDGGTGTDTLRVTSGDLDLSAAIGTLSGIEIIDLRTDTAANTVTLTAADVLAISDAGTLAIVGDIGDTAAIGAGWTFEGFDLSGNAVYTETVGADTATLLIGPDVTVSLASSPGLVKNGGPGDDTLIGTAGDDTLNGRAGNDTLIGLGGADSLSGGSGIDTVSYADSGAGVSVSLQGVGTASGGDAEGDTLTKIENLTGSAFGDFLEGDSGDNVLTGGGGNDQLVGHNGNDLLIGGAGADLLIGGPGSDMAGYGDSNAAVTIDLATGAATGGHAEGDILESIEDVAGSAFDDMIAGDAMRNWIEGGAGNDMLFGGAGDDFLLGGDGNDIIDGGLGSDYVQGLAGNDIFVFSPGTGSDADTVVKFTIGEDLIDLTGFGLAGMSDLSIGTDSMGAAFILMPSGDSITLAAVDQALLTSGDFIF